MSISQEDLKTLTSIVGREGAIAALASSKTVSQDDLIELCKALGLPTKSKDSRSKVAQLLIRHIDRRIDKDLDVLKKMSKEQLLEYFDTVQCDPGELIDLLKSIDIESRVKSRKAIKEFAAIQISSLGIFERIAE